MAFVATLAALLPGFAWLYFYLREDDHPEPPSLIAKTFIAGGACAFVALAIQLALQHIGITLDESAGLRAVAAILIFSFVEEIVKFGAAYVSVHHDPAFDEPIDAMIYMVVAALGFATVENIGAVQHDVGAVAYTAIVGAVFQTLTLRFVGATLLHTLSSGVVGYHWAIHIRKMGQGWSLTAGLALATVLHAAFNYLIISYGSIMYAIAFVVVMGIAVLGDFEKLRVQSL